MTKTSNLFNRIEKEPYNSNFVQLEKNVSIKYYKNL